jgi:hypothetical protein
MTDHIRLKEETLCSGNKVYNVEIGNMVLPNGTEVAAVRFFCGPDKARAIRLRRDLLELPFDYVDTFGGVPVVSINNKYLRAKVIKVYRDRDDYGHYYTVYDEDGCEGSYLPDDIRIKELEDMGDDVEWLDGIDNRDEAQA